jgi:hypothetical protein
LEILRNETRESNLFDTMRKSFTKRNEERAGGVKLTDLLYPKKAYWQKVRPLPPTNEEIQYWVVGRGHEDAVHRIADIKKTDSKQWNGIWYGIDFFEDHPVEMKTRRGNLAVEGEEKEKYDSYLRQLIGYCACEDKLSGELWVWSLLEKTDSFRSAPKMVCYDITFTKDEIEDEKQRLVDTKRKFLEALGGDMVVLSEFPDCPRWMCFDRKTNLTTQPVCLTCTKEFKTDWGLTKHLEGKGGKGHKFKRGTYEIIDTPKCQWYKDCRGIGTIIEDEQTP